MSIFKFAFPGKFLQNNRNVRDLLLLLPGFDKLTNLQLIFCYSLQLIFCQYCRLIFYFNFQKKKKISKIFKKKKFSKIFKKKKKIFKNFQKKKISKIFKKKKIFKNFQKKKNFKNFQKKKNSKIFKKKKFQKFSKKKKNFKIFFFYIPCKIRIIPSTPCKAQLNLQNLEANLQILLILL